MTRAGPKSGPEVMYADMAELVDALVSGTSGATLGSSSLLIRTTKFSSKRYARALKILVPTEAAQQRRAGQFRTFFGVVAQLIERYVRIVEVVGLSPISSTILRADALPTSPRLRRTSRMARHQFISPRRKRGLKIFALVQLLHYLHKRLTP